MVLGTKIDERVGLKTMRDFGEFRVASRTVACFRHVESTV